MAELDRIKLPNGTVIDVNDIRINTSAPTDGQVLAYNSVSGKFENSNAADGLPDQTGKSGKFLSTDGMEAFWDDIPEGAVELSALTDVSLTDLSANQMLKYNAISQKWENVNIPSDAFICTLTVTEVDGVNTYSCDKTIAEIVEANHNDKVVILKCVSDDFDFNIQLLAAENNAENNNVIFFTIFPVFALHIIIVEGSSDGNTDEWSISTHTFSTVAITGEYNDLLNKPTLGTASALDVAESGNASTTQVVKGDDTRLSDSRNAADVYPWAKAATKPSYTASEVGALPDTTSIPTKTSDLTNDSGFITSASIPTNVSDLNNDAGYISNETDPTVPSWAKASTKPSYTASEVGAIASSEKGANNGVAELDASGKVPSSQLPSYVDDVLEYASLSAFPATGESGKIYIALDTNKTYRWSGSTYTEISESLALGETSSTAYAGNKGKANADAIAAIKDGTSIDSFGDVETALADKINKSSTSGLVKNDGTIDTNTYLTQHQDISGKADKVSNATNGHLASLNSNGNLTDSGAKDSDYVHITGAETITGVKKFTQPVTMQNGAGPGSLIFGADVNAGTLTQNTRKLGRINSPTEDVRNGLTATLLGWDTQGNLADDMHTANRNYDTVSFGGMKKISTNTSPMNIVFCVTKKRNSKVPADKVYPIEMDANEVRFNVQPNYVGNRLLNTTDILDSTSSTATDKAATPNAVKSAYDLAAAAIPKSLGIAAGDIIYYTANGTPARLAKGTTGQVLTINSGATAPEWTDVPTELPALTNNANKILAVNSGATGVEWVTPSSGLTNYDFTHSAHSTVSSASTTVTFAANQRGTKYISVSADIDISFVVNNMADNYLWVANTSNSEIDVTFSPISNTTLGTITNYHMPEDPLTIPAGGEAEIGVIVNADGAFITYRSDLVKTTLNVATVNVSSSNTSYGTAAITGGESTYYFASGTSQSVTMTASPASGCTFTKWQSSSNGTTWTDVSGGTNQTLTVSLSASGTYYYKAIFSSGTLISAVASRNLSNGSSNASVYLGNNTESSISVPTGTQVSLSNSGTTVYGSSSSYLDFSSGSDFVVGYEYSTDNGTTWTFVTTDDSHFYASSANTIVRAIVSDEVYVMELTATTMAGDPSMIMMSNDYVTVETSIEGNFVSSSTLDYYNASLYIPIFSGMSLYVSVGIESMATVPGNFSMSDYSGNHTIDWWTSTMDTIIFDENDSVNSWDIGDCSGTLNIGYNDMGGDPNDPGMGGNW